MPEYDKGYEALSTYLGALNSRAANHKRAMTVKDLLIKVCELQIFKRTMLTKHPLAYTAYAAL